MWGCSAAPIGALNGRAARSMAGLISCMLLTGFSAIRSPVVVIAISALSIFAKMLGFGAAFGFPVVLTRARCGVGVCLDVGVYRGRLRPPLILRAGSFVG